MSGEERRGDGEEDGDGGAGADTPGVSDVDLDPDDGAGGPPGDDGDRGDAPEEDGNWRFTLEDIAEREEKEEETEKKEGGGDEGEGIAGVFGPSEEIEPGTIDRESVVFVLLGAIVAGVGLYLMVAP